MDSETFYLEELSFIEEVRNSSLYQKMMTLSKQIDQDEEIKNLASKRDDCYKNASSLSDQEREILLKEAKLLDDKIKEKEIVKEYLSVRAELKRTLKPIEDKILLITK